MKTIIIKKNQVKFRPHLLKDLADYLDKVDNQFALGSWVGYRNAETASIEIEHAEKLIKGPLSHKKLKECGTTACAMGHAPSVPSIAAAGLKLAIVDQDEDTAVISPKYKAFYGEEAAEKLFGIPATIVNYFFMPYYYPANQRKNPKFVADRIYKFLEHPVETCEALQCSLGE